MEGVENETRRDAVVMLGGNIQSRGGVQGKKVLGICNLLDNILGMPLEKVCHGISSRCLGS